jgi:hypothetical protein
MQHSPPFLQLTRRNSTRGMSTLNGERNRKPEKCPRESLKSKLMITIKRRSRDLAQPISLDSARKMQNSRYPSETGRKRGLKAPKMCVFPHLGALPAFRSTSSRLDGQFAHSLNAQCSMLKQGSARLRLEGTQLLRALRPSVATNCLALSAGNARHFAFCTSVGA